MRHAPHSPNASMTRSLMAVLVLCSAVCGGAQQRPTSANTTPAPKPAAPTMPNSGGEELDRVVAIVNGDLILDSDLDEERRFAAFQPYPVAGNDFSRERALERLINRDLILQQGKLQPEEAITDEEVSKDLLTLRKTIPECKQYNCETDAGWQKFLGAHGFTQSTLIERWRLRMQVLRFIEERFRMGIRITPEEIRSYYEKSMLPEYEKQHAKPPKLEAVSDRIQEVLLQRQVSNLLGDWLKSLRAQGSVVVLKQSEVAP